MNDYVKNFYELNRKKLNLFISQDPAIGDFDVVFEIDGKHLYAHKSKLSDASNTFAAMLSDRWISPNQSIKLEAYSFDDMKEFLTFIYSGNCNLTQDNISQIVDIAEFYEVEVFKKVCEEFLLKDVWRLGNVYQMFLMAYRYSMENLKKRLLEYVDLQSFIKSGDFLSLSKAIVSDVVKSNQFFLRQERLFFMVYNWAEHQHPDTEFIKKELSTFLPYFKFHLMNNDFLIEFVVKKSFLFSGDELSQILSEARYLVTLEDETGKLMKGILNCPDIKKVLHIVQSQIRVPGWLSDDKYKHWKLFQSMKPSKPSKIIKETGVEWYLVCDDSEYLAVRHRHLIGDGHYLLAKLIADDGFQLISSKFI